MSKYYVSILIDAGNNISVEADTPEEAALKAYDHDSASPSLCYQCAQYVDLGEAVSVTVYDESGMTELYSDDYRDKEIERLRAENTRLAAEVERLTKERDEARRTVKMAHEEGTRQIALLQARIDGLVAERTWQPIETAPKDGTRIIVCAPFGNVWGDVKWEKRPRAGERWTSFIGPLPFSPTHWMPLPRSPEAKP